MFRSILAAAAATLSVTAFTSAAQACISCEYVPEVVRENSPSKAKQRRPQTHTAAPRRVRPTIPVIKAAPRQTETAAVKKAPDDKQSTAAETTTATTSPSASLTLMKAETKAQTAKTETAAAPVAEAPEKIETGSTEPAVEPVAAAKEPVGCKRFVPAVGVTLTVACD